MTVFNDQATIQVGGHKNKNFVERPFRGVLAGVSFNGLRPLDLAASNDPKVEVSGDVRKLNNIPFDYKESHPYLFTKEAIIKQIDIIHNNRNHGLPQDRSGKLHQVEPRSIIFPPFLFIRSASSWYRYHQLWWWGRLHSRFRLRWGQS